MSDYDSVGSNYDFVKEIAHNRIESYNIRINVEPFLKGAKIRVIDFACGTGHYSHLLLTWGATAVLGMDLSNVMIKGAVKRLAGTQYDSQVEFVQGDATKPRTYMLHEAAGFELATAIWLLNYAKNLDELIAMFQTILMNLTPDGAFVGIVMNATDDIAAHAKAVNEHGEPVTKMQFHYQAELVNKQGYAMRFTVEPPKDAPPSITRIDIGCYHLKKSIFEEAIRAAGTVGRIEWRELQYLDREWTDELGIDPEDSRWQFVKQHPYMAVLVVYKT